MAKKSMIDFAAAEDADFTGAEWELVSIETSETNGWHRVTERLKLANGAIYRSETCLRTANGYEISQSSVFVPS